MSKGTGSIVWGSMPTAAAIAAYCSSCGKMPSAGCRLSAVRSPWACSQSIKACGSRKQVAVPGIAGPADRLVARLCDVPIHVDDTHRQRHLVRGKILHQALQLILAVGPVAAPPVTQQPARDQRGRTGNFLEILQTADIVVAIAKEVEVQIVGGGTCHQPALVVKDQRARVVDHGPTAARHQAGFQRHKPVGFVQGPRCALEIARLPDVFAKVPGVISRFDINRQRHGRKAACRGGIAQQQMLGFDREQARTLREFKGWSRLAAKPERLAGPILKLVARAVFHADQARRKQRKTHMRRVDHRLRIRQRLDRNLAMFERHRGSPIGQGKNGQRLHYSAVCQLRLSPDL